MDGEPIPFKEPLHRDTAPAILDQLGQSVVNSLAVTDPEMVGKDIKDPLTRAEACRAINGEIVVKLINELKVPAMIFTLRPDDPSWFNDKTWPFHSVGVIKLSEEEYVVFDQTNEQEKGRSEWFCEVGSLDDLSNKLSKRFGLSWDLGFTPTDAAENSVVNKIQRAEQFIKENRKVSYKENIQYGEAFGQETSDNLGITFEQHDPNLPIVGTSGLAQKLRSRFLKGHA